MSPQSHVTLPHVLPSQALDCRRDVVHSHTIKVFLEGRLSKFQVSLSHTYKISEITAGKESMKNGHTKFGVHGQWLVSE